MPTEPAPKEKEAARCRQLPGTRVLGKQEGTLWPPGPSNGQDHQGWDLSFPQPLPPPLVAMPRAVVSKMGLAVHSSANCFDKRL